MRRRAAKPIMAARPLSISAWGEKGPKDSSLALFMMGTMEAAVDRARELASPGEVVLLAPACASYDQFRDFEHRGDVFRALVEPAEREEG